MIHVTCVTHGLHRVAELVRSNNSDVNRLISSIKKIFLKAPSRTERFLEIAPNTRLPPSPVVTRRGSWIDAAVYYAKNIDVIKAVVSTFNPEEAQSIKEIMVLLETEGIKETFASHCC